MLNLTQLKTTVDSLEEKIEKRKTDFGTQLRKSYYMRSNPFMNDPGTSTQAAIPEFILSKYTKEERMNIIETASNIARSAKAYAESVSNDHYADYYSKLKYDIEWHRKFTLSIACIVLFFIGAPLGAIIRKGGLGMPVVISVIFFIAFHILSITGEKLAKEGTMPTWLGMWMATFVLLPIGIFLTYKATADSSLFDVGSYFTWFKKIFTKKKTLPA
jgi:lipopolysaccharide export system permease protein